MGSEEKDLIEENYDALSCPSGRHFSNGWATLKIDVSLMSEEDLDKLFHAEDLLNEIGIRFDTGMGGGYRDWELDWSLHGAILSVRPLKCMFCYQEVSMGNLLLVHWENSEYKLVKSYPYCDDICFGKEMVKMNESGWQVLTMEQA